MTKTVTPNAPAELTQALTPVSSIFTSPSTVTNNELLQAATDGFVLVTLQETLNGDRSNAQGLDDSNTLHACASQHYYTNEDRWIPSASFLMPAPNDSYYSVAANTTWGQPAAALQFMGLVAGTANFMQDWQVVAPNTTETASQDGFVVAWIDWNGDDGARGLIWGTQTLAPSLGSPTVAGASMHRWSAGDCYVPCNSFTMPVCKGTQYQIQTQATHGSPTFGAAFVPFNASVQLGSLKKRSAGSIYQAVTDGFLVAYLNASEPGGRGYVNLYSNANLSQLTSSAPLASTSIHFHSSGSRNIWVPLNTATIPVQNGNYYTADFAATWGDCTPSLWWVPITA
jgi:hypothetical protein